jgi:hypothetical protein
MIKKTLELLSQRLEKMDRVDIFESGSTGTG